MGAYILTSQGIIKAFIIVFNTIGFVVVFTTEAPSLDEWKITVFLIATISGAIIMVIMVILRTVDNQKRSNPGPGWMKVELTLSLLLGLYVLLASALIIDVGTAGCIAAGVVGLFSTLTSLLDIADKIRIGSLRSR